MILVEVELEKRITEYQSKVKVIKKNNNTLVTFLIWFEKFLNLNACILATINNHQSKTIAKVKNHKFITNIN